MSGPEQTVEAVRRCNKNEASHMRQSSLWTEQLHLKLQALSDLEEFLTSSS